MNDDELAAVITALHALRARATAAPPMPHSSRWALATRLRANISVRLPIIEPSASRWTLSGRLRE